MPYAPTNTILALNIIDLPTAADLSQTIEVKFTPDIQAKAQELGGNPVKIYEWVRNNIEYVPTYGSIQGADMCLQTKQCNDMDTASLLIALLRASNISARYVYGTIELPIDKVMNWVGGFTNEQAAVNFIASGGVPIKAYASGGKIAKVQTEHVWVETYVPYGPYSGRPSKLNPSKIWVPLDPSYKQYTYTDGIDLKSAVPFDSNAFINQVKSTATVNETDGSVTNVDSSYIQTTLTNYQMQLQNYINQNPQNATVGKIFGVKAINKQELGILPVTLPYKVSVAGQRYSVIPDAGRHSISFDIPADFLGTSLSYAAKLPELAGKRITLSYEPANDNDRQVIDSYGGIYNTPAYLVNVKPIIRVEGVSVGIGDAISLGKSHTFNIILTSPSYGTEVVSNELTAGGYHSIVFDVTSIPAAPLVTKRALGLKQLIGAGTQFFDDRIAGEILHLNGLMYFEELNFLDMLNARISKIADLRHPSEAILSLSTSVTYAWGVPLSVKVAGFGIDVDQDIHSTVALNGDKSKTLQYNLAAGMRGSGLENVIFEQMYSMQSISAVKALQLANQEGIPIYTINQSNLSQALPKLTISDEVKTDIINAVSTGKVVTVPQRNLQMKSWNGTGYIILDPETGAGAYMISGGTAGGATWADVRNCLTEFVQLVAAVSSTSIFVEMGGFFGGIVDSLYNPNSGLIFPLLLLSYMGFILGVMFVAEAAPFISIFSLVSGFVNLSILWASNTAATGNIYPSSLFDDCLSLFIKLFSSLSNNIKGIKYV